MRSLQISPGKGSGDIEAMVASITPDGDQVLEVDLSGRSESRQRMVSTLGSIVRVGKRQGFTSFQFANVPKSVGLNRADAEWIGKVNQVSVDFTWGLTQHTQVASPSSPAPTTPAGWYDDPTTPAMQRYWDGTNWTDNWQPRPAIGPDAPPPRSAPRVDASAPLLGDAHLNPKPPGKAEKEPGSKSSSTTGLLVIAIIVVIIFGSQMGGGGSGNSPSPATPRADVGEAVEAWVVCQQFLEDRLTAPSTAEYPSGYSQFTSSLGDGRFRVAAYVDAQNSFGAVVRTDFVCTVDYQGNDNWSLESLLFDD